MITGDLRREKDRLALVELIEATPDGTEFSVRPSLQVPVWQFAYDAANHTCEFGTLAWAPFYLSILQRRPTP